MQVDCNESEQTCTNDRMALSKYCFAKRFYERLGTNNFDH